MANGDQADPSQLPAVDPLHQQITGMMGQGGPVSPPQPTEAANVPPPPPQYAPQQGNSIKRLLGNFFYGGGQAMMKHVGLPTDEELQQKQFQQNLELRQTQSLEGMRQADEAYKQQQIALSQEHLKILQRNPITKAYAEGMGMPELEGMMATPAEQIQLAQKVAAARAGQGPMVTLPKPISEQYNLPAQLPLKQANTAIGMGTKEVGVTQGAKGPVLFNKISHQVTDLNAGNPYVARAWASAQAKAANTPYDTVIPGTNIPVTVSQAQALKMGMPHVNVGQLGTIGGNWAIYNDLHGIIDAMKEIANNPKVDLSSGKLAAAISAEAREEASRGNLTGALQRLYTGGVYSSLSPEEQTLATLYLQGKAGIIGMRKIMGQAGSSDVQRSLDTALFAPGGLAVDRATLTRGLDMTQGLLGRYAPGLVQAGLNAPGTQTAIPGQKTAPTAAPTGPIYKNKAGDRIQWNGTAWVPVPKGK